jgi:hypothetical protein
MPRSSPAHATELLAVAPRPPVSLPTAGAEPRICPANSGGTPGARRVAPAPPQLSRAARSQSGGVRGAAGRGGGAALPHLPRHWPPADCQVGTPLPPAPPLSLPPLRLWPRVWQGPCQGGKLLQRGLRYKATRYGRPARRAPPSTPSCGPLGPLAGCLRARMRRACRSWRLPTRRGTPPAS